MKPDDDNSRQHPRRKDTTEEMMIMRKEHAPCGFGSVWTPPDPVADDGSGWADPPVDRHWQAWFRLAGVLVAHGVDAADVNLLMPSRRAFTTVLNRQLDRERDAALAADPAVCSVGWRVCPEHGATLYRAMPRWRSPRTRCRVRGCGLRLDADALIRHCDQPASALVIEPETGWPHQMCAAHSDLARDEGLLVISLDDIDQDDDTADDDRAA